MLLCNVRYRTFCIGYAARRSAVGSVSQEFPNGSRLDLVVNNLMASKSVLEPQTSSNLSLKQRLLCAM